MLNSWRAFYAIEPWGETRQLMAMMVATLKRNLAGKYSHENIEALLDSVDQVAAAYMPCEWIGHKKPHAEDNAMENLARRLEQQYG